MATSYPSGIDSFSDKQNNVDWVEAADINNLQDAVEAIETELGANPSGTYSTVGDAISTINGALAGKVNKSGDTLTGSIDFDRYEAVNFKAELISTSSLPVWTAEDEGRIIYWEETDRLYVGDDSGWTSVGQLTGEDGIVISGSQISVDSTVVRTSGDQDVGGLKAFTYNTLRVGDSTDGSHKIIEAYVSESTNPAIRYNKDTEKWQYSDDGSLFEDLMHLEEGDGINVSGSQISVDSTVVRTTGAQSISGVKTFTATPGGTGLTDASLIINPASAEYDDLLIGLGVNDSQVFAVDGAGDIKIAGRLEWSDTNLYRLAENQLKTDDRLEIGGSSEGASSSLKVNASNAEAGTKLLWVGVNGSEKFSVNDSGNIDIIGLLDVTGTPDGANPTLRINPASAGDDNKLLWVGVNGQPKFTVNDSGDIILNGEFVSDLTLNDNYKLQWSDTNLYRSGNDKLKTDDRMEIVGAADSSNAALRVNPSTADANSKVLWVGVNGQQKFAVDDTGDTDISGLVTLTGIPFGAGPCLKVNPSEAGAENRLLWLGINGTEKFGVDDAGDTAIAGLVEVTGSPGESTPSVRINPSSAESGRKLLWAGVNGTVKFSVDESGNIELAGQLNSDLTIGDNYKVQWSDVNLYRSVADVLKTDDRVEITGTPDGSTPSIRVNPSSASTGDKLIWAGVNGSEKFSVNDSGDTIIAGIAEIDGDTGIGGLCRITGDPGVGISSSSLFINPSNAVEDSYLMTLANNGTPIWSVTEAGDMEMQGFFLLNNVEDLEEDDIIMKVSAQSGTSGSMMMDMSFAGNSIFSVDLEGNVEADGFIEGNLRCANSGSGAPTVGEDGDIYIDTSNNRLYVKIAGNWKYAALA